MFQFIPEVSRLQVLAALLPFLVFCFCFIPYRSVAKKHDKVHLITFENTKADVWFSLLHFILAVNVKMHYICICDWNSSLKEENSRNNTVVNKIKRNIISCNSNYNPLKPDLLLGHKLLLKQVIKCFLTYFLISSKLTIEIYSPQIRQFNNEGYNNVPPKQRT